MVFILKCLCLAALAFLFASCGGQSPEYLPEGPPPAPIPVIEVFVDRDAQDEPAFQIRPITPVYTITLDIDPASGKVEGVQRVFLHNTTGFALDKVFFNIPFNAFAEGFTGRPPFFSEFESRIFQHGRFYGGIEIQLASVNMITADFSVENTLLTVHLDELLQPGAEIEIGLVFEAYVPPISHRTGSNDAAMWFGNFLPTLVVLDEGIWNVHPYHPAGHPFFTSSANFSVTINTPAEFVVVATGRSERTQSNQQGFVSTSVNAPMVRDFAFAVLSLNYYSYRHITTDDGFDIVIYYHRDTGEVTNLDEILQTAAAALEYFSNRVDVLPYSVLNIVETELFINSSLAYPGLIFVDSRQIRTAGVHQAIVRSVVYQWFYNIVGHNPVTEAWLAHGLVAFLQQGFNRSDEDISSFAHQLHAILSVNFEAMNYTELSRNLSYYRNWPEFHNVQRQRGQLLFYALWQEMGSEAFDRFLQAYYRHYSFSIATAAGLARIAEETHGLPLFSLFDQWINSQTLPDIN